MYEDYEIVKGGWALPPPETFTPGSIIKHSISGVKYRTVYNAPNMKEANRASRKARMFSNIERWSAWVAFLPIFGAAFKIWAQYGEEETFNIIEVWDKVGATVTMLSILTGLLFTTSAVCAVMERKNSKKSKKFLKSSTVWELVEEPTVLTVEEELAPLKGLAKTDEELRIIRKEAAVNELLNDKLDSVQKQRDGLTPVSDSEYGKQ